ncbi:hypothetical protein Tco_1152196 [Tanacetum coccineum]
MNDLESDDESVDTPLVSPFPHLDNDSDESEVINELSEYENARVLSRERIINSFDGNDLAFQCMIGFRKFTANLDPFLLMNIISRLGKVSSVSEYVFSIVALSKLEQRLISAVSVEVCEDIQVMDPVCAGGNRRVLLMTTLELFRLLSFNSVTKASVFIAKMSVFKPIEGVVVIFDEKKLGSS